MRPGGVARLRQAARNVTESESHGHMLHYLYDEGHTIEEGAVYAPKQWTANCGAGGDVGAVSSSYSLKCMVPFVAHSGFSRTSLVYEVEEKGGEEINGCLLSGWCADRSHGICHNDIGAYRAIAHWFESVLRMASRCVESWCAAWHRK